MIMRTLCNIVFYKYILQFKVLLDDQIDVVDFILWEKMHRRLDIIYVVNDQLTNHMEDQIEDEN